MRLTIHIVGGTTLTAKDVPDAYEVGRQFAAGNWVDILPENKPAPPRRRRGQAAPPRAIIAVNPRHVTHIEIDP